jgi:hypothetical protein
MFVQPRCHSARIKLVVTLLPASAAGAELAGNRGRRRGGGVGEGGAAWRGGARGGGRGGGRGGAAADRRGRWCRWRWLWLVAGSLTRPSRWRHRRQATGISIAESQPTEREAREKSIHQTTALQSTYDCRSHGAARGHAGLPQALPRPGRPAIPGFAAAMPAIRGRCRSTGDPGAGSIKPGCRTQNEGGQDQGL